MHISICAYPYEYRLAAMHKEKKERNKKGDDNNRVRCKSHPGKILSVINSLFQKMEIFFKKKKKTHLK